MKLNITAIIFCTFCLFACKNNFFDQEPKSDPASVYEYFIADIKKHYGLFEYKGINIDTFGNANRKIVTPNLSSEQLFTVLATQLNSLKDGHNSILGSSRFSTYLYYKNAPENGILNAQKYIQFGPPQGKIEYRQMFEPNIGYINIDTFVGKKADFEAIDKAIEAFANKKGIIIDIRGNSGGESGYAEIVASRFADKAYTYGKIKTKLGPNKNDFSNWVETKIKPSGKAQFTKPVIVLTNRKCFSSAEIFLMIMENFPHVRFVGDTTGGGVGGPVSRELPNGWGIRLSTKLWVRANGKSLEDIGMIPNHTVWNGNQIESDKILEKAIELLK